MCDDAVYGVFFVFSKDRVLFTGTSHVFCSVMYRCVGLGLASVGFGVRMCIGIEGMLVAPAVLTCAHITHPRVNSAAYLKKSSSSIYIEIF